MQDLKQSYRAILERLLAVPARRVGATTWGMKEVRFGINEVRFLRWLYPDGKFVFVYRNPYHAYASYKSFSPAMSWYARWPDRPVFTPRAFAKHWQQLTSDYLANATEIGAFVIKYEDLVSGEILLDELADYCQVEIDKTLLETKVGASKPKANSGLSWIEHKLLASKVNPLAQSLGYQI